MAEEGLAREAFEEAQAYKAVGEFKTSKAILFIKLHTHTLR